ncbi:putative exopolygalacturonase X [Mycena indigotica]|uniref:galacturonan 1,4-alpha-galacturonidase n=1 Tax=Mycena indigotica TaxID=2126181 RepID=A0A8H6W1F0_9AGAR|nr:putative exopolygalacturonase X [Mycena indigotica]KAF7299446.1 putative exopolygalacturonase X [Mycena indigotica]
MRLLPLFCCGLVTIRFAYSQSCTVTALGSGKDDSPQLLTAMQSCSTVIVPTGTTLNISTRLNMTGLTNKHLNLQGTMKFNPNIAYWTANGFPFTFQTQITFWILGGTNLVLDGGGTLDGAGQTWYDPFAKNSSLLRPITLTIFQATNVLVQNVKFLNSPEWFNLVNEGKNVTYNNITMNAASTSSNAAKNTDGWDIYRSDKVTITNSVIKYAHLSNLKLISHDRFKVTAMTAFLSRFDTIFSSAALVLIASVSLTRRMSSFPISTALAPMESPLGQFAGVFDIVENVTATNIHLTNVQNGARIKCWAGSGVGSGIVKNITFSNFVQSKSDHPCYETSSSDCTAFPSNTLIQDVFFDKYVLLYAVPALLKLGLPSITGTSTGSTVASMGCSPGARCSDINVNNLALT